MCSTHLDILFRASETLDRQPADLNVFLSQIIQQGTHHDFWFEQYNEFAGPGASYSVFSPRLDQAKLSGTHHNPLRRGRSLGVAPFIVHSGRIEDFLGLGRGHKQIARSDTLADSLLDLERKLEHAQHAMAEARDNRVENSVVRTRHPTEEQSIDDEAGQVNARLLSPLFDSDARLYGVLAGSKGTPFPSHGLRFYEFEKMSYL